MKIIKKIFFFTRKDLDLKKMWWHRLFSVFFILSFISLFIYLIGENYSTSFLDVPQWKITETFESRINSDLKNPEVMIVPDEVFGEKNRTYIFNMNLNNDYEKENVYCSNDITKYIGTLITLKKVDSLYLDRKDVSIGDFVQYIKDNNLSCIIVDAYTKYNPNNNKEIGKLVFLEPWEEDLSNWGFFKVDVFKSIIFVLINVLIVLLQVIILFYIIAVIYHKVILYIIFGNKNNL